MSLRNVAWEYDSCMRVSPPAELVEEDPEVSNMATMSDLINARMFNKFNKMLSCLVTMEGTISIFVSFVFR